jgi:hypothetical protein
MKFKKTRIAFSACCGVLCLLLIGLWVRSYWWADYATKSVLGHKLRVVSCRGQIGLGQIDAFLLPRELTDRCGQEVFPDELNARQIVSPGDWFLRDGHLLVLAHTQAMAPGKVWGAGLPATCILSYWQLMLLCLTGGVVAWPWSSRLPLKFSLRTLLIFTTLVALILGVMQYFARI